MNPYTRRAAVTVTTMPIVPIVPIVPIAAIPAAVRCDHCDALRRYHDRTKRPECPPECKEKIFFGTFTHAQAYT